MTSLELRKRAEELLREIGEQCEIDTMVVMGDHVHVFPSSHPRYSASKIVEVLKSNPCKKVFEGFSWFRKQLCTGEVWTDGYFVRTVGDKIMSEVIR